MMKTIECRHGKDPDDCMVCADLGHEALVEEIRDMERKTKGELSQDRLNNMHEICGAIIKTLAAKNPKYGESWKSKGGFSAFFNLDRKWSRVENLAREYNYDIFTAIDEGGDLEDEAIDALCDLVGYALLILDDRCETNLDGRMVVSRSESQGEGEGDGAEPDKGYVSQDPSVREGMRKPRD